MRAKPKPKPAPATQDGLDKDTSRLILSADLANIAKKVKAGKPLSQSERELIRKSTKPDPPNKGQGTAYDSIAQAAAAMGVPKSVLRKLKRDGAPGFHGSRVYPGELRPHLETLQSTTGETADRDALECRRLLAQCKRIEHANLVESAGVIAVAPVLAAIATIGEQLKSALRAIYEDELPPVISGLSPEAIRIETRKANDRLCAKFFAGTDKIAKAA